MNFTNFCGYTKILFAKKGGRATLHVQSTQVHKSKNLSDHIYTRTYLLLLAVLSTGLGILLTGVL